MGPRLCDEGFLFEWVLFLTVCELRGLGDAGDGKRRGGGVVGQLLARHSQRCNNELEIVTEVSHVTLQNKKEMDFKLSGFLY